MLSNAKEQQKTKLREQSWRYAEAALKNYLCFLMVIVVPWYPYNELQELTQKAFKLSRDILSAKPYKERNEFLNNVSEDIIRLLSFYLIIQFCDDCAPKMKTFYQMIMSQINSFSISYEEFKKLQEQFSVFIIKEWVWSLETSEMVRKGFASRNISPPETDAPYCWDGIFAALHEPYRAARVSGNEEEQCMLFSPRD